MPCITLSSGKTVCFEGNSYSDGGPVNKNNPIQHKGVDINAKPWMKDNDSWFENIAEVIDPTGITSWDDVRRAGNNYGYDSPEAMIEMAGAVPLLGKIGKSGKIISGGFGLLHDVVKGASYLPPKLQKKVIDVAYPMYQKYAKAGGKELDESLGYGSKLIRDNIPLLNPSKWGSSEKSIQGFNILQKLGRSKSAYDAATGSKDNTGFSGGFGSPGPLQFNGRNVLPDLQSEYQYSYGGSVLESNVGYHDPRYPDGGFIKAEEGVKNKKGNVKKPSASSNVSISPRNPIIPLTPVVSGGELADQSASRNNNARMRSTTPISRPVVVTPPRPQPQPQPPVTNEEGLLDQLNNSANQFRQFLSDAYDRSLNATGEVISDLGDNITELLTPDYPRAPIYNEPEPQKNTPNTPPKPEAPKKDTPLSNMDKLKLQFIKDNNLNISPDQIYLGSDDRGRQVFRLYNDKDPKIQSYRNQFEAADNDERGITERPGMQISKKVSSNPDASYCIATATGLVCDQGFLNPNLMTNQGKYWNPAMESYAKNNKYDLTYNKKVNPLEFKGEPNSILQFTSEGHPFHATVLSDVYYPLDELNNPHYVTYGNPGASSSGVEKKIYTFSTPSKAEVEGEHYRDYPGGVPALIRSNYKKQNGGKNTKTITLSTGKVVTIK